MLTIMMLVNGSFICFGTDVSFLYGNIRPAPFTSGGISLLGGGCIFFGVISAFFVGVILKKTKKNLLILRFCLFGTCLLMIIQLVFIIEEFPKYYMVIISCLSGVTLVPAVPVLVNFAGEITFPQEPTVITGFMLMVGRIFGFFLALLVAFVAEQWVIYSFVILDGCLMIGALLSLFLKEDLKRSKYGEIKEEITPRMANRFSLAEIVMQSWRFSV